MSDCSDIEELVIKNIGSIEMSVEGEGDVVSTSQPDWSALRELIQEQQR
jgi:hypothetical protein